MLATIFLFRDGANVITYLTMDNHKSSNYYEDLTLFFELSFKFKLSFTDFTKKN